MNDFVEGIIELIKYRNDDNGYTVCELDTGEEMITAVGSLPFVYEGEEIKAYGNFTLHKVYGHQFNIESFEKRLPSNTAAVLRYLSSGAVKGIGASTASKIVDMFGDNTLDVIENYPENLAKIKGITIKKAREISDAFKAQAGMRDIMIFLSDYSLTPATIIKIWKRWGDLSMDIVKENPYLLCEYINSISFTKSEEIAASHNLGGSSPQRLGAGIKHCLRHNLSNGHTFLPREKLCNVSSELLDAEYDKVAESISRMIHEMELVNVKIGDVDAIYLRSYYESEKYVADTLVKMAKDEQCFIDINESIDKIEGENNIKYDGLQRRAIEIALKSRAMVLTGGPGTGKTTALKAIIEIIEDAQMYVALAAPTGRAVKRMEELCSREAKTIHRLLETEYRDDEASIFTRNEQNPLETDVLILDEVSMVDIKLMEAVLRALPPHARLILVGDFEQLPSVGPGNVLRDIIKSEEIKTVKLGKIFRQSGDSLIVVNAHRIISGEMPELNCKTSDFFFIRRQDGLSLLHTVCELASKRLPETYKVSPIMDVQILCPSRKGMSGVSVINEKMRTLLNPQDDSKREKSFRDVVFREGDKVMQIKNNYDIFWTRENGDTGKGIYNGDIGYIVKIEPRTETIEIKFDDKTTAYAFSSLEDLEHAYAITVHKSQGSEFEIVVIPLLDGPPKLFYRNLLYTAVTRAKRIIVLVGSEKTIRGMVENNVNFGRYTGLKYLLMEH